MNIVIYKGSFQYDVVNYFSEELGEAFRKMGHNISMLDLCEISDSEVNLFLQNNIKSIDLILSFNGINIFEKRMFEKFNIPLGIILVDHPFYHMSRINEFKGDMTFFCMYDTGFLDCFEDYIDKSIPIAWLPHGGTEKINDLSIEKKDDIVIPGSIGDYLEFEKQILELEGPIKKFASNLYERGKDYNLPLYCHLKEELGSIGIENQQIREDEDFLNIFTHIFTLVDRTLRARNRFNIIKNLLDAGLSVQHYGNLKNNRFVNYKNFKANGSIDYMEMITEIQKFKLLLHEIPCCQNGSHERVFTSMLNRTLVLSNKNNYFNNQYRDGENIVFYDMNDLSTLVEKAHFYLENEYERKSIESRAYEMTKRLNTWENRAKEILDIYFNFTEIKLLNS